MASSSNNPHYNPYDGGNDGLYNPYDGVNDGLDESFDEKFDDMFDQNFDSAFNALLERQAGSKPMKKKRAYIERQREQKHAQLWNDYFAENATYPYHIFRRRFRMNKPFFMHNVERLSNEVPYFQQRRDAVGRLSLSGLQKCTAAIRILAYGSAADAVDEYLRLGESTAIKCLEKFTEKIISLFGDEYLRRPTPEDLKKLLDVGEDRGFPGMV
ncbi:uncharacterized protein LOC112083906 [Eutrema salsugineum]|uniref:uncharacterized protein LOC112083906 n=1 Tax=Eutrema salsugineum TaxID=72664 RepID=UPI000CECFA65|nr:uncharacterized protein LOC112083906 [Eutrema salsugineum]